MATVDSVSRQRTRKVRLVSTALILGALALAPLLVMPAQAESYTVTMTNGSTFVTRYQPLQADWDPSMALLMTDVGNWIAVPQADIVKVEADFDRQGFGRRLDAKTVELGYVANDEPELDDADFQESQPSALDRFLNRSYDVQQFVDPSDVGGGFPIGGFPIGAGGSGGGGGGRGNNLNSSAVPAPQPAPSPSSGSGDGGS